MEERVTRLESNVTHIGADISEIKVDIRSVRQELREFKDLCVARFMSIEEKFASLKVWALLLYVTLAGVLLGVLARGFHWI
ncbi:MAG: hypothetical protein ABI885_03890 [Gammaproteobacteria bacterium]